MVSRLIPQAKLHKGFSELGIPRPGLRHCVGSAELSYLEEASTC